MNAVLEVDNLEVTQFLGMSDLFMLINEFMHLTDVFFARIMYL